MDVDAIVASVEKFSSLRISCVHSTTLIVFCSRDGLLLTRPLDELMNHRIVRQVRYLQNSPFEELRNRLHRSVAFGVITGRLLKADDVCLNRVSTQTNTETEVWRLSDFKSNPRELMSEILLFVSGDALSLFRLDPLDLVVGRVAMIVRLNVLPAYSYKSFKNRFGASHAEGTPRRIRSAGAAAGKVCAAVRLQSENDIMFLGRSAGFMLCRFVSTNATHKKACGRVVNTLRRGSSGNALCWEHTLASRKTLEGRGGISGTATPTLKRRNTTFEYVHSVYEYRNHKVFLNFKSLKKMKNVRKKKKRRIDASSLKVLTNLPGNPTRGDNMVRFQVEKDCRRKIERVLASTNVGSRERDVRSRAMMIVQKQRGVIAPQLARGVSDGSDLVFSLDSSDEEDESVVDSSPAEEDMLTPMKRERSEAGMEEQPPKKRRKLS